jgi:hypothetical protein
MTMTRRSLLGAAALLVPGIARSQTPATPDEYTPSDPARVGRSGRPQLVEFFHPR